ncbi:hypothetical protein B0J15DRAFT_588097 [Fusarium solani]|uniref:Uncharacterized protein n=1 Tax=Fusarium solani TaxID=169388 RepID=A0A9P9L7Z5_FUSSL|nr:uncharacterized protein B0J15DRAFT_588097 [Fusarium solani]KAH7275570.1 hypothetical protein B0J15DRAFT_588097 [Fusarium solani]
MADEASNQDEGFGLPPRLPSRQSLRSPRNNILSAAASTEGVDDTSIPSIPGDRVQEAFDELRTGELQRSSQPFTTHARTFIEHITQVIKEKQANPKGKAKAENAESPVSVRTDDSQ